MTMIESQPTGGYELPVSFTCTGATAGWRGELMYAEQATALGYLSIRWGAEHRLDPHALDVSRRLGAKWPEPDWISWLDIPGRAELFGVYVRGQRDYYPGEDAWNFTIGRAEIESLEESRWFRDHHAPGVFALVSWTGSIHIATSWQVLKYAEPMGGYSFLNAHKAELPTLADVRSHGLPYAPS